MVTDSSGQNNNDNNNNDNSVKYLIIFSEFILEVLLFIGGAILLGLYLDKLLNTKFVFLLILIMLFGFVPIYNLVKRMNTNKN